MALFNQFSFLFFSLMGAAIIGFGMWRFKRPSRLIARIIVLGIYGVIAVVFVLNLNFPSSNTDFASYSEVEDVLHNGRPTFVMLYSQFCVGCIASLPAARDLENQVEDQGIEINMLFLDIHTEVGRTARAHMSFNMTPTYLVYNTEGQEVLMTNSVPAVDTILTAVTESESSIGSAG